MTKLLKNVLEVIPFWMEDPTKVFVHQLHNMLDHTKYSNGCVVILKIERMDIITGGDHGAGVFRCLIRI